MAFRDYSKEEKVFEVAANMIKPSDQILIVDEWSETGSQLKAATKLVELCGGVVCDISVFSADEQVRQDKELEGYKIHSVL